MKQIKIKIPDECGAECICFEKAKTDRDEIYRICRAFKKVLTIEMNGYGTVVTVNRCEECQHSSEEFSSNEMAKEG